MASSPRCHGQSMAQVDCTGEKIIWHCHTCGFRVEGLTHAEARTARDYQEKKLAGTLLQSGKKLVGMEAAND